MPIGTASTAQCWTFDIKEFSFSAKRRATHHYRITIGVIAKLMENTLKMVGNRIKHLRNENGLSIEDLAGLCELSPQTIKKIEKGSRNFKIETLIALSKALGVSTDYILGLSKYDEAANLLNMFNSLSANEKLYFKTIIKEFKSIIG